MSPPALCFASAAEQRAAPLQPQSQRLCTPLPKERLQAGFAEICFYKLCLLVQQVKEL